MSDSINITPVGAPVHARVRPPGSKSITNRALVCAALARGTSTLRGALDSDDTRAMIEGLGRLGFEVQSSDDGQTLEVAGTAGQIPATQADLFCGNSGTTIRFLTAIATLGQGAFRLDGVPRMRQRPIGDLLAALEQLGADARAEMQNNCPPVVVHAHGLPGGVARLQAHVSSQFLSGLLMATPCADNPVELTVDGALVSKPYVRMTMAVMRDFGVQVECDDQQSSYRVSPAQYVAREYAVEPDASAASYFWAAAAITGGKVSVAGLSSGSLQGDVAFVDALARMGCAISHDHEEISVTGRPLHGIDIDMNAISDTVQTLAVVALFAEGPTRIRGVAHNRHKETDRIGDLATELRKLGAAIDEHDDGLTIHPGELLGTSLATYDDHRMAMSLALAGLRVPGVAIQNPGCVAKTYPNFFRDLELAVREKK